MSLSLRLSDAEMQLIKSYAAHKGENVSEIIRNAVLEKIEDELDLATYEKAIAKHRANPISYTQDEVERMLFADE